MSRRNKNKTIGQKAQILKRKVVAPAMSFKPFHLLVKNRRAVSAVMSNLILIGAVMAVGLVVLAYARSNSINYQTQYAEAMNFDIGKLKESLTFEYAHYGSNQLSVYVMNSGPVDVTIKSVSINNSPVPLSALIIHRMSDNQLISNNIIGKGTEVKILLDTASMTLPSGENNVKITSRSDSNFAYNFLV